MSERVSSYSFELQPPLDWNFVLRYLNGRKTSGVESMGGGVYRRAVKVDGGTALLSVSSDAQSPKLHVSVNSDATSLDDVSRRVHRLFDLGFVPGDALRILGKDPIMGPLLRNRPGIRVPGAWCNFELIVRTIVGQQVSVQAATTIMGRIAARVGSGVSSGEVDQLVPFPVPEAFLDADLLGLGMPGNRAETLRRVAAAIVRGDLNISGEGEIGETKKKLLKIAGVGPWTVEYFALRGLRDPDAWPGSDLILKRTILAHPEAAGAGEKVDRIAERWRPYRGYAAVHLWAYAAAEASVGGGGDGRYSM